METHENHKTTYLKELKGSDFEMSGIQPAITGWELTDTEGNKVGIIEGSIFDSHEKKIRYLITSLGLGDYPNRNVLIPVGIITLDREKERVILSGSSAATLTLLPTYESGKIISPVEELAIRYIFLGGGSLPDADAVVYETHPEDFYIHVHFNDENLNSRF